MNSRWWLESVGATSWIHPPANQAKYGRQCLAVSLDGDQTIMSLFADLIEDLPNCSAAETEDTCSTISEALRSAKTDSLGRGVVIYFPGHDHSGSDEGADDIPITGEQYFAGFAGECIQDVAPTLSNSDREFILSGAEEVREGK